MDELKESILILISTPLYATIILFEIVVTWWHNKPAYSIGGTVENVFLSLCNVAVDLLSRGTAIWILNFFAGYAIIHPTPGVLYWVTLVIALDFAFYWLHRVDHRCRLFWAMHVTHHSSDEFNFTVGFRSSVFQPLYRFFYFIPLALLGYNSYDIYFVYAASQIYGIILHTKWTGKMGILDWILVTPSHHRVHHGSNPEYIDKNMGMVFIFWDRMFGTFQEEIVPVKYGITHKIERRNPVNLIFHEWADIIRDVKRAPTLRSLFVNIFGPPEESITAKQPASYESTYAIHSLAEEEDSDSCKIQAQ